MNVRERFAWWVSGQISKTIAEEFDSTTDAILLPTVAVLLAWILAYTSGSLLVVDSALSDVVGTGLFLFVLPATLYAIITVLASYEFATSTTHDALDEVHV